MSKEVMSDTDFSGFELSEKVLQGVSEAGYSIPTPIQEKIIPTFMSGADLLGQAQTGTGKTAAFALPLLSRIDISNRQVQVLVLTPTRELAIQVAESFKSYAAYINGFEVLAVYGGQDIKNQLKKLRNGVHVVVGTPGRVMDHIRRGTLKFGDLECLVLDEADEMLHMGFIEDVEWIIEKTPPTRQIALFSATLPPKIRTIARKHLNQPAEISIQHRTTTAETIHQRYWIIKGLNKLDALTRILEVEPTDGVLVFVRTRSDTVELAEQLKHRGFSAVPLNGDIPQAKREITVEQFKSNRFNILVATDVAARGLDVDRISHVINYDVPHDSEQYIHRVGRTGRAGRTGEAIIFFAPKEQWFLHSIEKANKQRLEVLEIPSAETINKIRIENFKKRITDTLNDDNQEIFRQIVREYHEENGTDPLEIATALAKLVHGNKSFLLKEKPIIPYELSGDNQDFQVSSKRKEKYRIELGHKDGVKPGDILGAIANEVGLDGESVGKIQINREYTFVHLPKNLNNSILRRLKNVKLYGKPFNISSMNKSTRFEKKNRGRRNKPANTKGGKKTRAVKIKKKSYKHS